MRRVRLLRRQIEAAGAARNIPPVVHRRWKPCFSPVLYRGRNRIEWFFNRIKYFRRLATRYEKHASNFLAMLKLAVAQLQLRHNKSVTLAPLPREKASDPVGIVASVSQQHGWLGALKFRIRRTVLMTKRLYSIGTCFQL
jgi:hypothetical protein